VFSACFVQSVYREVFGSAVVVVQSREFWDASLSEYDLAIELTWQLQNNVKKGIRRCKGDLTCDLR
jgi:hypothetical protein